MAETNYTDARDMAVTDPVRGLSREEVQRRTEEGFANVMPEDDQHSLGHIIFTNVFTYFNMIFVFIAVMLFIVGAYKDMTFIPLIVFNTLIGILQQWRSKVTLEKLTILNAPKTTVVRGGSEETVQSEELVLGDIILLGAGNQIPADAVVVEGRVQVNESLLTGEAQEIEKMTDSPLLSGSFIVSGHCRARLTAVGADSYAAKLTKEARRANTKEQSEMIRSLNVLLRIIGVLIIPVSITLFVQQYKFSGLSFKASVTGTIAAIIGMIPEGLYLLTSVALAVSAVRLARSRVLVHDMKSIETLARVDVLCVDKTGTITQPKMQVADTVPLHAPSVVGILDGEAQGGAETQEKALLSVLLGNFAASMDSDNDTMRAIKSYYVQGTGEKAEKVFSFSPVYKYSAAQIGSRPLILGAPEFLLRAGTQEETAASPDAAPGDGTDAGAGSAIVPVSCAPEQILALAEDYALKGYRVLLFGEYTGELDGGELKSRVIPMALVLLENPIRPDAKQTFRYFEEQGVDIMVISGDNPAAVSAIAMQAGIPGAENYIDASTLRSDPEILNAVGKYTVFGRVTPEQKRTMVLSLQKRGHTVAMTGDGVNDVLALREADCSAAMASGSSAAASAAQLVLLDSDFARMPMVVSEGRRVVNNIQRTASLFLVKNIFSILLSLFSIILMFDYPLEPSQMSLISMFTIGIPAALLALENSNERIEGRFLSNVFLRALPAGLTDFIIAAVLVVFCDQFRVSAADTSTACTILLGIVGMMILYRIASPMTVPHWVLWFSMLFGLVFCMTFMNRLFSISSISRRCGLLLILFAVNTVPVLQWTSLLVRKIWDWEGKRRKRLRARRNRKKYAKRPY